jgi:hypothetical protein
MTTYRIATSEGTFEVDGSAVTRDRTGVYVFKLMGAGLTPPMPRRWWNRRPVYVTAFVPLNALVSVRELSAEELAERAHATATARRARHAADKRRRDAEGGTEGA